MSSDVKETQRKVISDEKVHTASASVALVINKTNDRLPVFKLIRRWGTIPYTLLLIFR